MRVTVIDPGNENFATDLANLALVSVAKGKTVRRNPFATETSLSFTCMCGFADQRTMARRAESAVKYRLALPAHYRRFVPPNRPSEATRLPCETIPRSLVAHDRGQSETLARLCSVPSDLVNAHPVGNAMHARHGAGELA